VASIGDENAGCAPAFLSLERSRAMLQRRRIKQTSTLEERRVDEARRLRETAKSLPERDRLLRKARQNEAALHVTEWLSSPGLKPPV
jgi:hypothetical protein